MEYLVDIKLFRTLLFTLAAGLWLYWLWTRRSWYRFSFRFPCFFGLPLLGAVNRIIRIADILQVFSKCFMECKQNTFCGWLGMYLVLVTSDPDKIEKILSAPPELMEKASNVYQPLYDALNGGLVSSRVKEWSHHRKLINPSFNHKVLLSFFPIFHKAKKQILCKFDDLVGTGEHRLKEKLAHITLRITVETTMGMVVQENDKVDEKVIKVLFYLSETVVKQIWLKFIQLQWLYFFNPHFHTAKNYLHNFVHELIISKLQCWHESENNREQPQEDTTLESDDNVLTIKNTPKIFIDQAIQMYQKQQFTWNDIIAESNTIVVASFETIATVLSSTFIMLAMHTDVQEKLYEEIVSVFPEKDFQMEYEHLEQLSYLAMVLNETLRLAPPAPIIARQPVRDTQLTKDILLPKDLHIMISIFHLHRNKDLWGPNANKFNPDNFLPDNLAGKHSHAFIPFSKGFRNCIGWRYAMYALKVLIVGSVRNFRFTTTFRYEDLVYLDSVIIKYLVEPGIEIHRR